MILLFPQNRIKSPEDHYEIAVRIIIPLTLIDVGDSRNDPEVHSEIVRKVVTNPQVFIPTMLTLVPGILTPPTGLTSFRHCQNDAV